MKIAITGNSGFIGSALMRYLSGNQSLTLFPFDKTKHSLASIDSLKSFVENKDIIIHLAGITNPEFSENCYRVNTLGTVNLLQAIHLYGKPNTQLVFSSSFAVYEGTANQDKLNEDNAIILPRNHYGMSKKIAEELVTFYNRKYNIPVKILRISNPYGPSDKKSYNGIVQLLIANIKNEKPIIINGDGTQTRDFIFLQDVVYAVDKVINYKDDYLVINICSGKGVQLIELVRKVELLIGKKAILEFNKNYNDKRYWIGNPIKAKETINFSANTSIDDGLQQTIAWYLKNIKK